MKVARLLAICTILLLVGCATSQNGRLQDSAEYQKSVEVFGGAEHLHFCFIKADPGPAINLMVTGLTKAYPSGTAKEIGRVAGLAHTQKVDLAVTGDSQMLTRVTVVKGLGIQKGEQLSNLRVLYIGNESDRNAIEQAVKDVGGEFYFVAKGSW